MLHLPNFVQIFPKLHLAGVGARLIQIPPQKHLPVYNLRAVLVRKLVQRPLKARTSRLECPCGNVILKELPVDDVDDGGDQGLDILGAGNEGFDVVCSLSAIE